MWVKMYSICLSLCPGLVPVGMSHLSRVTHEIVSPKGTRNPESWVLSPDFSLRNHSGLHSFVLVSSLCSPISVLGSVPMAVVKTEALTQSVSSVAQSCPNLCNSTDRTTAHQASLSITSSRNVLKLMSTKSVMPSNHLILCHPLLLLSSVFPSIRVFSSESVLHIGWPEYWSFSFTINPSNEYSGLISFRVDWFDLLAVQGTLKSLLQHHSSKAPVLRHSAFFIVQLSHPYMTTGKTIALTRWTLVVKIEALSPS